MNVLDYLVHLWAVPPVGLQLPCPAAAAGQTTNLFGSFDDNSVRAAFATAGAWSAIVVAAMIFGCYFLTRKSSGPGFDKRWVVFGLFASALCFVVAYGALHFAHTTAMAQSCESNPSAFAWPLPAGVVMSRAIAGLVWGALAFFVLSIVMTAVAGWYPSMRNGFYHNRGTPWPRLLTGGK